MAKATKEFRATKSRTSKGQKSSKNNKNTQTSVAYRTVKVARERQKREIEQQKREKFIFALFVVAILVMIIFAILVFKKVLGNDVPAVTSQNDTTITDAQSENTEPIIDTKHTITVSQSAVKDGTLLMADSAHPCKATNFDLKIMGDTRKSFGTSSSGKNIYSYYVASTSGTQCNETALAAFNSFANDFYIATQNVDLFVSEAHINDKSAHSTGYALDLKFWTGGSNYFALNDAKYADDFKWLQNNAHKYGFAFDTSCDADFCLRYVGIAHAYYMHKHDLSLENYLELVKRETLAFTTDGGDKYEVSYVHAAGDVINIELPSPETAYELSGDNMEGIILTVKID